MTYQNCSYKARCKEVGGFEGDKCLEDPDTCMLRKLMFWDRINQAKEERLEKWVVGEEANLNQEVNKFAHPQ